MGIGQVIASTEGLSRVLDDGHAMARTGVDDRTKVRRLAEDVDDDHRLGQPASPGAIIKRLGEQRGVEIPRPLFTIDQTNFGSAMPHRIGAGDEGAVIDQDEVARPDAEDGQGEVDGGGPAGGRHRMRRAHGGREVGLETVDIGPHRADPTGRHGIINVTPGIAVEAGFAERDRLHGGLYAITRCCAGSTA